MQNIRLGWEKVKVMIPLPENAEAFSQLSVAHYLASQQYEYFVLGNEETPGNMTVETIDGIQYLTFETSSFSPFNVGGSQLVGPKEARIRQIQVHLPAVRQEASPAASKQARELPRTIIPQDRVQQSLE